MHELHLWIVSGVRECVDQWPVEGEDEYVSAVLGDGFEFSAFSVGCTVMGGVWEGGL